jgi:tetratricopeptide (TPR) repeat protein
MTRSSPTARAWQRDLSIVHSKMGDVFNATGRRDQALDSYRKDLAITVKLVAAESGNAQWQRDLSISYDRIGEVLINLARRPEGVEAYRKSLAIREKLAAADPGNTQWQDDLIISLFQLARQGDEARERLTRALALARSLDAQGRLEQKGWIRLIEQSLAALPR